MENLKSLFSLILILSLATGIGDYSVQIAEKLLTNHDIFTHFLTYELWFAKYVKSMPYINQFPVKRLTEKSGEHFFSLLPDDFESVIFHYNFVEPQETAFWLLDNLRMAQKKRSFKLVVMFHELTTKFKRKGIYLPAPKHILSCLSTGRMADSLITNNSLSKKYLSKWLNRQVFCLPNFSTIGEPEHILPLSERNRTMIVFGSKSRSSVYQKFYLALVESCKSLKIEKIYDIGPSCGLSLANFQEIPLVEMGVQPPEVIEELMLSSIAGFLDYSKSLARMGKSTIFAAFCSHGLLPISTIDNQSQADGLKVNQQYVVPSQQLKYFNEQQLQDIANNANKWYKQHSLDKITQTFAGLLN